MNGDRLGVVLLLCTASLFRASSTQRNAPTLNLDEGDICKRGKGSEPDYVCKSESDCELSMQSVQGGQNFLGSLRVCSYYPDQITIVCCPLTGGGGETADETPGNSFSADEMCREYSRSSYGDAEGDGARNRIGEDPQAAAGDPNTAVFGGRRARENEFPHMALLGYLVSGRKDPIWLCSGSLVSSRWIMSAGFCHPTGTNSTKLVIRARLGVVNSNDNFGKDFRVQQSIPHPDFDPPSLYDNIALFRLETDVRFSRSIRPICLNADNSLTPNSMIATGYGKSFVGDSPNHLLKIYLNTIPTNLCNIRYFMNNRDQLEFGINSETMICAAPANGKQDTCGGDFGGPLQVKNVNYPGMYTQFGIISFGISAKTCTAKDAYTVYTRVSKYIPWIEKIVWPKT